MADIKIGDSFYFVPEGRWRSPQTVTVAKIGTKWLTFAGNAGRADRKTLAWDSGDHNCAGHLYASEADYRVEKSRRMAWDGIKTAFRNSWGSPPAGLTEDDIRAAAKLLKIDLDPAKP